MEVVSVLRNITVSNNPAYTEVEASNGVDGRHSRIVYYNENGVRRSLPYHPLIEALNPKYDNNLVTTHRHHTGPTGLQYVERLVPEEYIAIGANPYYQFIQRIIGSKNVYTAETIFKRLTEDYVVLPKTVGAYRMLLKLLDEMHDYGYLFKEYERVGGRFIHSTIVRYKMGVSVRTGDYIYEWKQGYDPIMWHMGKFIEKFSIDGCPKEKIRREFMHIRYWIKNDIWLEKYLDTMKRLGYIVEFPRGLYKLVSPVQPFNR
ncbi:MAG: hypothetical protein DRN17_01205 [Thermoplasmata archaeon]|nr:MAG: hypothetical protein DRN17_01205 [Thermoplasmata archaeon]